MVSQLREELRKYYRNRKRLRNILKETQRALDAIAAENFIPDENVGKELLRPATVDKILQILEDAPSVVILGQDSTAKAKLVNRLLAEDILPLEDGIWRWIRLSYGETTHISLTLNLEYEVVDRLQANERTWSTIPIEDLTRSVNEDANCPTVLDVKLARPLLCRTLELFIAPSCSAIETLSQRLFKVLPIFVYALGEASLSHENIAELRELKESFPEQPILFISCNGSESEDSEGTDLTESEQHQRQELVHKETDGIRLENCTADEAATSIINLEDIKKLDLTRVQQLSRSGFNCPEENAKCVRKSWLNSDEFGSVHHLLHLNSNNDLDKFYKFVIGSLQNYLVRASTILNDIHTTSLRKFILSAFDMARELQITPRRICYVRQKETDLYNSLMKLVGEKQEEVTDLIQSIIDRMKSDLTESDTGTYRRESIDLDGSSGDDKREWSESMRTATLEVRRVVLSCLSEQVAEELMTSVDCLRETFVGTLQRCLLSLEKSCEHESNLSASDALKQILSAAYNVELTDNSWSFVHSFLERLRQLVKSLPLPWSSTPTLDVSWRKRVAIDVLNSLNSARLSRAIATQFRDKVKSSHDSFQSALRSLENHYSGRLERTEEQRVAIRKFHAPRLARLALESTSTSDLVRFGVPPQGKEIGRGQYGVVFSCEAWGGAPGPCAIKSVVPPDDKHWNDLAMEFYYTRSIPDHKRIVKLRGSVIDESYGGGCGLGAAVLLVTDRLSRDLYCGIRAGLSWLERIQIAIDVVEGIRYLHSQGLVHRDIKLKNVLLDTENRAKLTDLGFCIPEAMMSGSVVGTPVHMAPELLSGHYDSSVDVYAFGVLFWYICAGNVRLPFAFEQFHNKEQLWTSVRKGLRPERLEQFDDECWTLMEQCWAGEPSKRPLLGAVLPVLESVREKAEIAQGKCRVRSDSLDPSASRSLLAKSPAVLALTEPFNQRGVNASNNHDCYSGREP